MIYKVKNSGRLVDVFSYETTQNGKKVTRYASFNNINIEYSAAELEPVNEPEND